MADVARAAGVSRATASYALRDDHRIKPETRAKVLAAAERVGYRLNRAAAILGSRDFRETGRVEGCRIALLHEEGAEGMSGGAAAYDLEQGREYAASLGHDLESLEVPARQSLAQLGRRLHARGVDGLILSRFMLTRGTDPDLSDLGFERFSAVSIVHRFTRHPCDHVRPNFFGIVRRAFEHLLERGGRRIGAILPHHDPLLADDRERLAAYLECQQQHLAPRQRLAPLRFSFHERLPDLQAWVRKARPDALISFLPHYLDILSRGHRLPPSVSLHVPPGHLHRQRYDGFDENRAEVYRQAVDLLDQRMRRKQRGLPEAPVQILVPPIARILSY